MIATIFILAAFILFCLAAFNIGSPKFNLTAAGLACLVAGVWLLPLI